MSHGCRVNFAKQELGMSGFFPLHNPTLSWGTRNLHGGIWKSSINHLILKLRKSVHTQVGMRRRSQARRSFRSPVRVPSGFPAPKPAHACLALWCSTHFSGRSRSSLTLEAPRHRLLGLPVCPCGFQIVLLHLSFLSPLSYFTSVFLSPPPVPLTSDSSFSFRDNSHTSTP